MTSLRRATNGDWFSRKRIPDDVRPQYEAEHGNRQEERFRRTASVPLGTVTQEFRDWDADICSRIERLRAKARGEGEPALTPREAHALAGAWYSWFVAQFEEDPGTADQWDARADEYEGVCPREFQGDDVLEDDVRTPAQRRAIHRVLTMQCDVDRFLHDKDRTLSDKAMGTFLDALEGEFLPVLALLRRRTEGDWSRDTRQDKFPTLSDAPRSASSPSAQVKLSGLNAWEVFELWIEGRKPAPSSVNRWRAVFISLRERFGQRDAATISAEEVQEWADGLTTPERSAQVVHEVWLRAARTLFAWAVKRRKLSSNPFAGTSVPVPKRAPKLREREFNEDEWRTILRATLQPPSSRMESHNAAARRWVPWLCAYTGSRPGEACQLRAEDIQQHRDGFWTINITPEAGTVKGNVARVVPLHEHLAEQGFVEFAQAKRSGPLFYDPDVRRKADDDPTNPTRQPWVKARDKISEWVRALGVSDLGISPSHAWRHTYKRRAARAGIERRIRFAMCGHSSKEEGDNYETPTIEDLAAEVRRFPRYEIAD